MMARGYSGRRRIVFSVRPFTYYMPVRSLLTPPTYQGFQYRHYRVHTRPLFRRPCMPCTR